MKNLLGGANEDLHSAVPHALGAFPEAKLHLYGKGVRAGRKLGHVNVVAPTPEDLPHAVEAAEAAVARLRDGGSVPAGTPLTSSVPSPAAAQEA